MNVDDLAGRAGRDMRDSVRVDVDAELEGFRRAAARRRLTNASLLGAKVVLSLLAATGLARWLGASGEQTNVPVGPPTGVPSSPAAGFGTGAGCEQLRVACRDGGTSTIYLDAPLVWTLPHGFDSPYSGELSSSSVETRASGGGAGVTVLEHVSAATSEAPARPVPGVRTAAELARWLADRPFLSAPAGVRTARVGDEAAWVVDARVPLATPDGPATCSAQISCYPLMTYPEGDRTRLVGARRGISSRYTIVDLHESGITVVWSWSSGADIPAEVDDLVAGIRFEGWPATGLE